MNLDINSSPAGPTKTPANALISLQSETPRGAKFALNGINGLGGYLPHKFASNPHAVPHVCAAPLVRERSRVQFSPAAPLFNDLAGVRTFGCTSLQPKTKPYCVQSVQIPYRAANRLGVRKPNNIQHQLAAQDAAGRG